MIVVVKLNLGLSTFLVLQKVSREDKTYQRVHSCLNQVKTLFIKLYPKHKCNRKLFALLVVVALLLLLLFLLLVLVVAHAWFS